MKKLKNMTLKILKISLRKIWRQILPIQLRYKIEDKKGLRNMLNINRIQDLEANTKLK